MKIVKVNYVAMPDYAEQNMQNIRTVMSDLRNAGHPGIWYDAFVAADGKSFTHLARFDSEDDHKILNALPAFLRFQEQLKARGFEVPPKQELLTLVGSTKEA